MRNKKGTAVAGTVQDAIIEATDYLTLGIDELQDGLASFEDDFFGIGMRGPGGTRVTVFDYFADGEKGDPWQDYFAASLSVFRRDMVATVETLKYAVTALDAVPEQTANNVADIAAVISDEIDGRELDGSTAEETLGYVKTILAGVARQNAENPLEFNTEYRARGLEVAIAR